MLRYYGIEVGFNVMSLLFITKNEGKVRELEELGRAHDIAIIQVGYDYPELQADTLEEVARWSALHTVEIFKRPFIIEDSGLFIEGLGGFPGPYSAYAYKTVGNKGILKLMSRIKDRRAIFKSVIAFCQPSNEPVIFAGSVEGEIAKTIQGREGFGFDPIFLYGDKTFGEIATDEKNEVSHRRAAFDELIGWVLEHKDVCTI